VTVPNLRTVEYESEEDVEAWRRCRKKFKQNPEQGFSLMLLLAQEGSLLASLEVGRAYMLGVGATKNFAAAEIWFRRVAVTPSIRGHYFLGRLLTQLGRFEEGREALKFAAARGFAPALHELGKIYFLGRGVEKDLDKSVQYLRQSSERGNLFAKRLLGRILILRAQDLKSMLIGFMVIIHGLAQLPIAMLRDGLDGDSLTM